MYAYTSDRYFLVPRSGVACKTCAGPLFWYIAVCDERRVSGSTARPEKFTSNFPTRGKVTFQKLAPLPETLKKLLFHHREG